MLSPRFVFAHCRRWRGWPAIFHSQDSSPLFIPLATLLPSASSLLNLVSVGTGTGVSLKFLSPAAHLNNGRHFVCWRLSVHLSVHREKIAMMIWNGLLHMEASVSVERVGFPIICVEVGVNAPMSVYIEIEAIESHEFVPTVVFFGTPRKIATSGNHLPISQQDLLYLELKRRHPMCLFAVGLRSKPPPKDNNEGCNLLGPQRTSMMQHKWQQEIQRYLVSLYLFEGQNKQQYEYFKL
ncbi:hypothetical protein Nepgr_024921 [Nepenthes gracilis]|uniref:Uncharacterized protein n=1 Tax=Nepenthes gracilis TaxID=150966 RepID=A0AAD3T576_NEPGR|nr:hypothetical protein Nepgr_024921 [Nepenthes gracilis]